MSEWLCERMSSVRCVCICVGGGVEGWGGAGGVGGGGDCCNSQDCWGTAGQHNMHRLLLLAARRRVSGGQQHACTWPLLQPQRTCRMRAWRRRGRRRVCRAAAVRCAGRRRRRPLAAAHGTGAPARPPGLATGWGWTTRSASTTPRRGFPVARALRASSTERTAGRRSGTARLPAQQAAPGGPAGSTTWGEGTSACVWR
jgi:hypothetical protein